MDNNLVKTWSCCYGLNHDGLIEDGAAISTSTPIFSAMPDSDAAFGEGREDDDPMDVWSNTEGQEKE